MLGVIVKWLMSYIDGQAKRIESISKDANETQLKMAEAFNKTIQDHLVKSAEVLTETRRAVDELCHLLKLNGNGTKLKV